MLKDMLDEFESNLKEDWNKTYYTGEHSLEDVINLYVIIKNEWEALIDSDNDDDVCYEGINIISKGLGEAILYFDTDIPEQNDYSVIRGLSYLVESNQDKPSVKKAIVNFNLKNIRPDFE